MTNEQISFMIKLLNELREGASHFSANDFTYYIKESETREDCFEVNIEAKSGNAKFSNCVIFYSGDDFDMEEILEEVEQMIIDAKRILNI